MKNQTGILLKIGLPFMVLLWLSVSIAKCESLHYEILKDNKRIGQINIEQRNKEDLTEYIFESTVKLRVIFLVEVHDKMQVVFKGKQLLLAFLYRTLNGRVKVDNSVRWNEHHYDMTNKEKERKRFNQQINFTTAYLYYHEPVMIAQVFSENFQQFIPIRNVGGRRYRVDLPNGHKTFYTYVNGVCNLVEAETDWADLKFVLKSRV